MSLTLNGHQPLPTLVQEGSCWICFRICNIAYKTIRSGNNVSLVCVHMDCFGWWVKRCLDLLQQTARRYLLNLLCTFLIIINRHEVTLIIFDKSLLGMFTVGFRGRFGCDLDVDLEPHCRCESIPTNIPRPQPLDVRVID
jgi:hypothetical protein